MQKFEGEDHSSSSDNDEGRDEAQYRITVPLDVRLAAAPLFAAPTCPSLLSTHPSHAALPPSLPSLPVSHSPMHASLPAAGCQSTVETAQLVRHPAVRPLLTDHDVRPLLTVPSGPADLLSMPPANAVRYPPPPPPTSHHHHQQLLLAESAVPLLVRQPRCRDYDGECLHISSHVSVYLTQLDSNHHHHNQ